jgi:diguanylate cyclase (GGDEF)-like protein/PAS domain S-box-containing protein
LLKKPEHKNATGAVVRRLPRKARLWFDQLPLGHRFLIAFALPILSVIWMSVAGGLERLQTVRNVKEMESFARLATLSAALVSQLQWERGVSAIHLASQGQLMADKLGPARESTDNHIIRLQQALVQESKGPGRSSYNQGFSVILQSLNNRREIRYLVDHRELSADEITAYFTRRIESFNRKVGELSAQATQNRIGRTLNAYFILNRLRELLAQERAVISRILLDQSVSPGQLRQLSYLAGRQDTILVGFQSQTQDLELPPATINHPKVTGFRENLFNPTTSAIVLAEIDAETWFGWQSERVERIRVVEQELAQRIQSDATELLASARNELWRYGIFTPLILAAAAVFGTLIFRNTRIRLQITQNVFDYTHDRITVTDSSARIIDVNQAFTRMTGYTRSEVLGKNPGILQSGRQDAQFYKAMWSQLTVKGQWQGELWNRRKNGEFYAELTTISAVKNPNGRVENYIAVSSDITERAFEHERQLQYQAYHDALTGLPNHALARDRLESALQRAKRSNKALIVASLDLDHFKHINDSYGHEFGDTLLQLFANRLTSVFRDGDTVARVGGDEFLVIVEDIEDKSSIRNILERSHAKMGTPLEVLGKELSLSVSIGATSFPHEQGRDADTLIRNATQALHDAKHNGRSRLTWFDPVRGRDQSAFSDLIRELEQALAEDEFRLYYQPKVNMVTGQVLGFEALLRWEDPDRGLVPPGQFLPQIEAHPLSITVGNWVIEQAIRQMMEWQARGITMKVSVNINALQLLASDFVDQLKQQLAQHPAFSPSQLELEILESAAIGDIQTAAQVLNECRRLGIGVSLDDFGTGYAALDYLKRLPAENLKIDQSFVRDMDASPGDRAIVRGIIGLANAFGFGVIAEGVESIEQGSALIELGCHNAQGYGIARPMPADSVPGWLASWQAPQAWLDGNTSASLPAE